MSQLGCKLLLSNREAAPGPTMSCQPPPCSWNRGIPRSRESSPLNSLPLQMRNERPSGVCESGDLSQGREARGGAAYVSGTPVLSQQPLRVSGSCSAGAQLEISTWLCHHSEDIIVELSWENRPHVYTHTHIAEGHAPSWMYCAGRLLLSSPSSRAINSSLRLGTVQVH